MKTSKLLFGLALGTMIGVGQLRAQSSPPVIDTQPVGQTATAGSDVTFTVTASGTDPLSYQWYFANVAITDETNSALTLLSVQETNVGDYTVLISNDAGTALSEIAHLDVTNAPPLPPPPPPVQTFLDFNEDGKADLLWVHPNGTMVGWLMDGTNFLSSITLPMRAPRGWNIAGEADFDHDGKLDLLWQHMNGRLAVWYMDNTNRLGISILPRRPNGGLRVVGLTDFDKDGNTDIVWQHGNGRVAAWLMDGTNFVRCVELNDGKRAQGGWKIVAVLDIDNDGDDDFLWQHGGGLIAIWYMDGLTKVSVETMRISSHVSSSWNVTGFADLNGDGENDLVWRNSSGRAAYWLLYGPNAATFGYLRNGLAVPGEWEIKNK